MAQCGGTWKIQEMPELPMVRMDGPPRDFYDAMSLLDIVRAFNRGELVTEQARVLASRYMRYMGQLDELFPVSDG